MKQPLPAPTGGPWFRVPTWIGGRLHGAHIASDAEAWVDLLGRWHQGEDPSAYSLVPAWKWSKGRILDFMPKVVAWARENGATMPARWSKNEAGYRPASLKGSDRGAYPTEVEAGIVAGQAPEKVRPQAPILAASCARNSSSSEKRSEGELERVSPPPEPEPPKAAEPEPAAAPERTGAPPAAPATPAPQGWRAIVAEMKARAPVSFPEPPKPPPAPPSIEDEDLGPSPVAGLDLSALMGAQATMHSRLMRALVTAGVSSAEQLERSTYEDLKFMHGVGQAGAMAIQRALREHGTDLALDKGRLMLLRELATAHPRPFPPEVTRADRLGLRAAKVRWRYLVNADDFQMNDYAKALEAGRRAA